MQSISLADELTLEPAPGGAGDELVCPAVPGPAEENLAAAALRAFRSRTGWDGPPVRLSILKRIPVAAGLAGGSADAAAALRLASHVSGLGDEELLRDLSAELGADVPAQVSPGRWLASGAGERLHGLPDPSRPVGLLLLAQASGLSTAEVYRQADRLGQGRSSRSSTLAVGACAPRSSSALRCPVIQSCCTTTCRTPRSRCARRSALLSGRRAPAEPSRRSSAAPGPPWSGCSRAPTRSGGPSAPPRSSPAWSRRRSWRARWERRSRPLPRCRRPVRTGWGRSGCAGRSRATRGRHRRASQSRPVKE